MSESLPTLPDTKPLSDATWVLSGYIAVLLGVITLVIAMWTGSNDWWLHGAWCLSAFALLAPPVVRSVWSEVALILTDHRVVFTAAFVLYYVVGASILAFGSPEDVAWTQSFFPVSAAEALWLDALNSIGLGIALVVASLSPRRLLGGQAERLSGFVSSVSPRAVVVLLMIVGALAYGIVLVVDLGFGADRVSGALRALSQVSLVSIILAIAYRGRSARFLVSVAALLALVEVFGGLVTFSKTAVLLPLGALVIGLALRRRNWRVLVWGVIVLALVLFNLGGVVTYSRNAAAGAAWGIEQRLQTVIAGFSGGAEQGAAADYSAWGRLCYLPAQKAAIQMYDAGNGGSELRILPWVFVPRIIAPDKPIITSVGREFYRKMSGSGAISSSSPGVFVAGYYNVGWLGLVFFSAVSGWILAQTSSIAQAVFRKNALALLPFALMGTYIAFRIDGHFTSDYVGAFVFILYPMLAVTLLPLAAVRGGGR